jgi:hypothetical protein
MEVQNMTHLHNPAPTPPAPADATRVPSPTGHREQPTLPGQTPTLTVPLNTARRFAASCTPAMDDHRWSRTNTELARRELTRVLHLVSALADRMRHSGWVVVDLPAELDDEELRRAAAAVLAAFGRPFNSIDDGTGALWIGTESAAGRDAASFGGLGAQGLHQDAPNVELMPDVTALLFLRPDPAGGGASLIGDLYAAAAELPTADREELRLPVFHEGRADRLRGVGAPRLPFPILEDTPDGVRIRWAAKLLTDPRNTEHRPVLSRFADILARHTTTLRLDRGQLLILNQHRAAHGRKALGDQSQWPDGTRRLLVQAKASFEPTAPAGLSGSRR